MFPQKRSRAFVLASVAVGALVVPVSLAAQTFRADDPVIRRMWTLGMDSSHAARNAQVLMDSIGPRLSGTAGYMAAGDWIQRVYDDLGITNRREPYGTWRGWQQGATHVDLIAPRIQTLEAELLAWSPGTTRPIDADVIVLPEFDSPAHAVRWLRSVRGKAVLLSAPLPSCREPQALARLAREATVASLAAQSDSAEDALDRALESLGGDADAAALRLDSAGVAAIITSRWSGGWGVNKIFDATAERAVSIDLSCEDFGLLHRLASNEQSPRVRIDARAELKAPMPMFNVIAELRGTELPEEYVVLSAHLDSWHGATGATDNGTGTITMLEAMRILKEAYPNPRRTILVGHWGGEEQGLIGSRAFTEDHPEVVENLQVAFNQDNGTWRIEYIQAQGLLEAGGSLARWISHLPTEISEHIKLDVPGPQETGGSDHVSFLCHGAPGFRLQSNYPDYRQYTWHTNRDTYDKIIIDDLKNNATLAAMLAYLASEDPARVSRERSVLPPNPRTGEPRQWLRCGTSRRSYVR